MVNFQMILAAKTKLAPLIKETPLLHSNFLSEKCKGQIYLKMENQQITNSFKIRGAFFKILQLSPSEKEKGIITSSSGNHAQAIGVVAEKYNLKAKIIVPKTTPKIKIDRIKQFDVRLERFGQNYDEAEIYARKVAKVEDMTFVSGYNDELIIAGQGTIGLEILDQLDSVTDVLVPLGGGGLLSGIAIAIKTFNPSVRIYGIQTEACPAFYESLKAGKIIDVEMRDSIADGMYGGIEQGSITFDIIKELVDEVIVVREQTIKEAIAQLWFEEEQIVEGAGAAAIAPILENPKRFAGKNVVCVISGGNIDTTLFQEILDEVG
ncbi:MAG: threonine ammonia-lyase [Candidatus Heimdallarchaeota archaeon]